MASSTARAAPPPPPPSDPLPPPPPVSDLAPPPPPPADLDPVEDGPELAPRLPNKKAKKTKEPPSLEEMLRKKKQADDAASKPVFVSKKQRELAAAAAAAAAESQAKPSTATNGDKFGEFKRPNGKTSNPPSNRAPNGNGVSKTQRPAQKSSTKPDEPPKDAYTERYMGPQQTSTFSALKKRKRTTDKKFSFDWSANDDTSNDTDPLYNNIDTSSNARSDAPGSERATKQFISSLVQHAGADGPARARQIMEMEERRKSRQAKRDGFDMRNWTDKPLEAMTPRDWRLALSHYNISVKGGNLPKPARNWQETGLPGKLLDTIEHKIGYKEPSAIQRMAIPISLQGRDVIGIAETGSGKTAAFALPLLTYIEKLPPIDRQNPGPYAIILAPTRELAQQIESETRKLAQGTGYKVVSITGGHSIEEQSFNLRDGAEIIVATPGRLVDVIDRRIIVLSTCCYIIMDEADRMIDMGFQDPLDRILSALPVTNEKPDTDAAEDATAMTSTLSDLDSMNLTRYRQTHLYSATFSAPIQRLARQYTRRPAEIQIGEANTGVETVTQYIEFINGEDRRKRRLADLLSQRTQYPPPMIVFVNVKKACDALARDIRGMGRSAVTLHGAKTQEQREEALARLRAGAVDVLVATDLAARGIDVPDVSLVVNFAMPAAIEPYLHRIGRTGRAGKSGTAVSFISNDDADIMYDLKGVLQRSALSKIPDELRKHPAAQQRQGRAQRKIEQ